MLQSLRDNLKGTVAVIIIAIFAVPMVLFGVEKLFVGSLGGNDVATVDGTSVTRQELRRAIYLQKQRILSENDIDPSSEFLKDENLREPVLRSLTRQKALLNAAKEGDMTVANAALWEEIMQQPQFQTEEGFSQGRFQQFVTNIGFPTTGSYLQALADSVMLSQQNDGIVSSAFLTEEEIQQLIAIAQQTRSYFSVTVPATQVEESVTVSDEEIADYYAENQQQFAVPEKVALNYIEMDLDTLAARQEISEADLRAQFEQELAAFDAEPQYEVSHILIEEGDKAAEQLEKAQTALAEGRDFAEVAQEFSEDLGTRDEGGYLGRMVPDAFPEPFEEAVKALEEGEVSGPVETEAGTHLIKVNEKTVPTAPTFAEQRDDIEQRLRRSLAEQKMATIRDQLDDLTFSSSDLQQAAAELDLEVQSTPLLPRGAGTGLMQHRAVQEAAFSPEVLEEGHNSPVLELPGNRLAVIRVTDHEPARIQPLEEVAEAVKAEVLATKTDELLTQIAAEIQAQISAGADAAELAEARGYAYEERTEVSRSDGDVDRQLLQRLFTLPRPAGDQPVLETFPVSSGDHLVLGLTGIQQGTAEDMPESQLAAMRAQLSAQTGRLEASAYENHIVNSADIKVD